MSPPPLRTELITACGGRNKIQHNESVCYTSISTTISLSLFLSLSLFCFLSHALPLYFLHRRNLLEYNVMVSICMMVYFFHSCFKNLEPHFPAHSESLRHTHKYRYICIIWKSTFIVSEVWVLV